jgi:tetratricopeptide (TPR) repeat protein
LRAWVGFTCACNDTIPTGATDIYSLGVLLYELLTGATPFETNRLHAAAYDEIRRIIREEEPVRPSTKVSTLGKAASTIAAHRKTEPQKLCAFLRGDLDWIIMKALEKDRTRRYDTAKDFAADVLRHLNHEAVEASPPSAWYRLVKFVRRNKRAVAAIAIVGLMIVSLLTAAGVIAVAHYRQQAMQAEGELVRQRLAQEKDLRNQEAGKRQQAEQREADLEWLRTNALPQLEALKGKENFGKAWSIAELAYHKFPDDPKVRQLRDDVSCTWTVITDPPGAKVSRTPVQATDATPEVIGTTPIDRLTGQRGMFLWTIELEGYEPVEGLAGPQNVEIRRTLSQKGSVPGMVLVETIAPNGQTTVFWIDRYEVTNRDFKEFVRAGGYRDDALWLHPIVKGGSVVPRNQAIEMFCDSTGKPGPATWSDGTFPAGEDDFPVRGVSWYEAVAYAEFRGKTLPNIYHWEKAASIDQYDAIVPASNFVGQGPAAVGSYRGMGFFGVRDMAGNVKEWCWNRTAEGYRTMRGGAWNEPGYMFERIERFDPSDRKPTYGFRCVRYVTPAQSQDMADLGAAAPDGVPAPEPLSRKELQQLMTVFRYDKGAPLNAQVISVENGAESYRHETVKIDTAYGGEQMDLHIYLPKGGSGPHQTLVFFPGVGSIHLKHFSDGMKIVDGLIPMALVGQGRTVCWPIYKGTFERRDGFSSGVTSFQDLEFNKQMVKDLCRTVDYLATRSDIDMDRLAYVGFSWGAGLGPLMTVVESRFKASILISGSLWSEGWVSELKPANYAPFASLPVLMLNGRTEDMPRQDALLQYLAATDKSHELYDSGHIVPMDKACQRIGEWLDARFGQVRGNPRSSTETAEQLIQIGDSCVVRELLGEAEMHYRNALEIRKRELGADHVDTALVAYLLGTVLEKLDRDAEALQLLDDSLRIQREKLGENHVDTSRTAKALADLSGKIAYKTSLRAEASTAERQQAVALARRALDLDVTTGLRWSLLAWANYRCGDWHAAHVSLERSFAADRPWVGQWLLASMIASKLNDTATAKDWYTAARASIISKKLDFEPLPTMSNEASSETGLPLQWPPVDWSRSQYIEMHSRLIEKFPSVAQLYHTRGSHLAATGAWSNAAKDYAKAAELDPSNLSHAEAHAMASLALGDSAAYQSDCRQKLSQFRGSQWPSAIMDCVLLSALSPDSGITPDELLEAADEAISVPGVEKSNPFLMLGRAAALYRCKRYEEALESLAPSGFDNPKDELLTIVFRAMSHWQLGDAYTSRRLLRQARGGFATQLSAVDGPELPYQDRMVVWAMVQTALREAEALIDTSQISAAPHMQ